MNRFEIQKVENWDQAQQLAAEGWELVSVTERFEQWENPRKGNMESETYQTYYFKRPLDPKSK